VIGTAVNLSVQIGYYGSRFSNENEPIMLVRRELNAKTMNYRRKYVIHSSLDTL
jgi:hypothetical protein